MSRVRLYKIAGLLNKKLYKDAQNYKKNETYNKLKGIFD